MNIRFEDKNKRSHKIHDALPDQSKQSRLERLLNGRCPCHDKVMLQSDVWYTSNVGKFTFLTCSYEKCRIEAIKDTSCEDLKLIPEFAYLMEQDNNGSGEILPFNRG